MPKLIFPKHFIWGVASSAYQIEGAWNADGKGPSIWDVFSHKPGKTAKGETGDVAIDHYHRYKDDIQLMAELGIPTYRFSVAWSRVMPTGMGAVNPKGLAFYDRLVDELLRRGIEPYVCLYHFDLPQALQDKGGWPERATAQRFGEYAGIVAAKLSDRVRTWITHNEPLVTAGGGYLTGEHAPGVKDPLKALRAGHHLLLSHGLAAQAIRAAAQGPVKVGIVLNLSPVHPASDSAKDRAAADRLDLVMNRVFLDGILKGTSPIEALPLVGKLARKWIRPGDLESIRTCDLLGVNYYTRNVMRHDPRVPIIAAEQIRPEGNEYSAMWEIYPEGLYELLTRIWKEYKPECDLMVTENGVPVPDGIDFDGRVRDERRIRYLRDHIAQVHRAIKAGVPVKGYFVWSLMDNYEWALGYGPRFGLVYVDYATQKRIVKDSGRWFGEVVRTNSIRIGHE